MSKRIVLLLISIVLSTSLSFAEKGRYLIITPDAYYNAILPLAEWKTKKGMLTKVSKLSETGSSSTQIRSYITNAYNTWEPRPEYVLLVGDDNIIPMPSHGGAYDSDNYYTDIEGDLYNEMIPGRFPASNVSQVNTMVSKTLGYERTPYMYDTLWFRKGTVIVREDGDWYDDSIYWDDSYFAIDYMLGCDYVVVDTFCDDFGDNATDVENAITDGRTYVQFRGQGVGNWWSPFGINVNNCNCGFKLPVVVSATCATYYGVGYNLLRAGTASSPKGGVGCAATSTVCCGCAHLRSALTKGFVNSMFRGSGIFGMACEAGRKRVYHLYNDSTEYNGIICLGDPELNLWTYTPESLLVIHPDVINLGMSEVTINVREIDSSLIETSAIVCLMMDSTVYEHDNTDAQGDVTFTINTQNIGDMFVTVTAKNYIPYEGTIPVYPVGPYLIYLNSSITDTLLGNRDGIINPGEKICLDVLVKNVGNESADSVYATISLDTMYLTVLDSINFFGDILPDSDSWGENGYTFLVSPDCPSGYIIDASLTINDADKGTWNINLPSLYVYTGKLEIDSAIVYDTLPGDNGNSKLDPGETVHLHIALENVGPSDIYGAECVLRCISENILIEDSILIFEPIWSDSTVISLNFIEIMVSPFAIPGFDIPFELYSIEECSTYTHYDTILFYMKVGEVGTDIPTGPDEYGYYCYDYTDTLYGSAPTYDWLEITPPGPGNIISSITNEDARTTTISLPFDFKYYGTNYSNISICSNGFLTLGYTTYRFGDNCAIPDTHGPANMVAPFWFDLDPSQYGDIYQYYDETNHRWICEFKDCAHYYSPGTRETFQAILLDPDYYPTPTGDGEIIFQYEDVGSISTATVGIENSTQDVGIQYYYNYIYDPTGASIHDGTVLKFTTSPMYISPWILFHTYFIVDTSGNNDSIPNPGEDIEMYIYFENLGNSTACSLSTTLTILDSLITTDDSVSSFGDIPVGDVIGNISNPYNLSISHDFDDSTASFYLHVESNSGWYETIIPLTIDIGPPVQGVSEGGQYVFELKQNYPNPMNSKTHIKFQIPTESDVMIDIYNLVGMHVKMLVNKKMKPGVYTLEWKGMDDNGNLLPGGVYFYRIDTGVNKKTRKLIKLM
ncbi:T9SS type A sorting domain-containing protein [candidate division WOR-3 bacterium]|nr:T9SS type A sorting domain-containing protein [candidate division WOR-3 bacterium]